MNGVKEMQYLIVFALIVIIHIESIHISVISQLNNSTSILIILLFIFVLVLGLLFDATLIKFEYDNVHVVTTANHFLLISNKLRLIKDD